jgi:hypothetical protein
MDENGLLAPDAALTLLCTMHFPRSAERRREFYAVSWAHAIRSKETGSNKFSLTTESFEVLADARPREQVMHDVRERFLRGILVGEILALICCHAQQDPTSASRNKAQNLQRTALKMAAKTDPSLRLPSSEGTQHTNWRRFSPVAHLWAGLILASNCGCGESDIFDFRNFQFGYHDIPQLLGLAESFRRFGEQFKSAGQRPTADSPLKTVLDPNQTWKCPDDLDIPEIELELDFDGDMSWLLDQYNYTKIYGLK